MSQSSRNARPDRHAAKAVLSLGSNLGDREHLVLEAASRIATSDSVSSARLSSLYETEPVGEGYTRIFINAVMTIETSLSPGQLLKLCQEVENALGRDRKTAGNSGREGDRTMDVDIILYGEEKIDEPDLQIPHPRYRERKFVLAPLAELEPGMGLPAGAGEVFRISSRKRIRSKQA